MSTEPLPMLEAVGEVLAEMDGPINLRMFRHGQEGDASRYPDSVHIFAWRMMGAEKFARLLAFRGWRLVPIGVVNADEVVK